MADVNSRNHILRVGESLDFQIDYTAELADEDGDVISQSVWDIPGDLTEQSVANPISADGMKTSVWVEGGTAGKVYTLQNTVTTAGGRVFVDWITVNVVAVGS